MVFPAIAYGGRVDETTRDISSREGDHAPDCLMIREVTVLKIMHLASYHEPEQSSSILEMFNTFPNPYPTTFLTYFQISGDILDPKFKTLHSEFLRTRNFWDYVHECEGKSSCTNPFSLYLCYSAKDLDLFAWKLTDKPDSIA